MWNPIPALQGIFNAIFGFSQWLWDMTIEVLTVLWYWTLELIKDAAQWLYHAMPEGAREIFQSLSITPLVDAYDLVTYAFPIHATLGIIIATYTTCGVIRFIRWLLGFAPTLNAG